MGDQTLSELSCSSCNLPSQSPTPKTFEYPESMTESRGLLHSQLQAASEMAAVVSTKGSENESKPWLEPWIGSNPFSIFVQQERHR